MGGGMVMSMGGAEDGPMEDCCNRKAACFQTCGMSKKACDKDFEKCTEDACAMTLDPDEKSKCESSAKLQVMLAGMSGDCAPYDAAQSSGCQCMAPEKAVSRREKTLNGALCKKRRLRRSPCPALASSTVRPAPLVLTRSASPSGRLLQEAQARGRGQGDGADGKGGWRR